jgi:hypothetical protein
MNAARARESSRPGSVPGFNQVVGELVTDLERFIALYPSDARGYEMRGLLRLMKGEEAGAEWDFKKSVELDLTLSAEIEDATRKIKARFRPGP